MTFIPSARSRLARPALSTKFHIDYDWWQRQDRELRVYLRSHLCPEHQAAFADTDDTGVIDWVDPETAEVQRVDGLQHVLRVHCSAEPGYITDHTSLVDAVFRVFLANGNQALSPAELAERVGRPADTILRTLSGQRVYKGLRPFHPEGR